MVRKNLLTALRERIIPWVKTDGIRNFICMDVSLRTPANVRVVRQPGPPLEDSNIFREYLVLGHWGAESVNSIRFPYFGFVLEGEADLRMGVTERMVKERRQPGDSYRYCTLSLPERVGFIYPPGVPCSDASRPHWEREGAERAFSRIFWMHILPSGAMCHICSTVNGNHLSHPLLFVADARLTLLADIFLDEIQGRKSNFEVASQANLLALLTRVERALSDSALQYTGSDSGSLYSSGAQYRDLVSPSLDAEVVQRTCQFVETHLRDPLSLESIARNVYVSTSHLNRIFRAATGLTVMKYVSKCRLDRAKSLLQNTDLPVGEISVVAGFSNHSYFGELFVKATGVSPGEFRRQHASREIREL